MAGFNLFFLADDPLAGHFPGYAGNWQNSFRWIAGSENLAVPRGDQCGAAGLSRHLSLLTGMLMDIWKGGVL